MISTPFTNIPVLPSNVCSEVVCVAFPLDKSCCKIYLLSVLPGKIDFLACSTLTKSWIPVVTSGGANFTEIPDGIKDLEGYNLILFFCDNTSTK